jgi:4-carboxymuconolactone decarboxylase
VVPGHGPVTDIAGIIDFRDYLAHLLAEVQSRFSRGMPLEDTVVDLPLRHWAQWSQPENLAVTVATIYRQLGSSDPASSAAVTTLSAEIAAGLRRKPRIKPIPPGDHDPEAVRLLGLIHGEAAIFDLHSVHTPNVILTSLRHPWLFEPGVPLARAVVTGILAGRDREMLILRGAWNCAAAYQWNHHRQLALAAGLSDAEIDLLSKALPQSAWTTQEAALLQAADELHAQSTITDQTWALLEGYYNEQELIELVTLVGEYTKVSFQLNAWQVSVEMWLGPIHLPSGWTGRST